MPRWLQITVGGSVLGVVLAGGRVCPAQPQVNEFEITLFGRHWRVTSYFVQDDLQQSSNEDTYFEPEGLAFQAGTLFASGDRESYEAGGRLAIYDYPSGGPLSLNHFIQMPSSSPNWWGPEGLSFNMAGRGYGGGANMLVSVDRDADQAGIIDLASGSISGRLGIAVAEDLTFLPGLEQFAILRASGSAIEVAYRDLNMFATGQQFPVAAGTNGLVGVSASFGSWFTCMEQSTEILVAVTKASPGNAILVYDLTGRQIGPQHDLPVLPKARIPLGGPFYMLLPAFGTVEAIAADEANKVLFIGDENNTMIHVLTLGPPAADLDHDADVDQADMSVFDHCFTGASVPYDPGSLPAGCTAIADATGRIPADLDRDGDVDHADFGLFQRCYSGADEPADPCCAD